MLNHEILKHVLPVQGASVADVAYNLSVIKALPGVIFEEPIPEVYVAVLAAPDDVSVSFAAFAWHTEDDNCVFGTLLFRGEGTGSALREMRHITWGQDDKHPGYLFYMPLNKTIAALELLKKYFDPD